MRKFIRFYLLNRLVKDPILSATIYEMMYHHVKFEKQTQQINLITTGNYKDSVEYEIQPVSSRKDDLLKSLDYLRTKPNKTKQDKESIGILEAVLKNER